MPHRIFVQAQNHVDDITAAGSATISMATASYAWLGAANEVVQLIAGIAAIASGCFAVWYTIERIIDLRTARRDAQSRQKG